MAGPTRDAISMLCSEHREAEELIERLEQSKTPGPRRRELVERLRAALVQHLDAEEKVFYPAVAAVVGDSAIDEANNEHELVRDGLRQLEDLVDGEGFGAAVGMLKAGIDHHVEDEESEMFPNVRHRLGEERLHAIGEEMASLGDSMRTP